MQASLTVNQILNGDAYAMLKQLEAESVDTIMTSPPYLWLRDYGTGTWEGGDPSCNHLRGTLSSTNSTLHDEAEIKKMGTGMPYGDVCGKCGAVRRDRQIGLERSIKEYVEKMLEIGDECKRVLKPTGSAWFNLGDTFFGAGFGDDTKRGYNEDKAHRGVLQGREGLNAIRSSLGGYKDKCLCCVPDRFKIGMIDHGWVCRMEIIWYKPNSMPSSVEDRFKVDYEKLFCFVKSRKYWFNKLAVQIPIAPATVKRNAYPVKEINHMEIGVNSRNSADSVMFVDDRAPEYGGLKHAGKHNKTYSGRKYKHSGFRNLGSTWIWSIAPKSFGKEYCPTCDRLVKDRDLLFQCIDSADGKVKGCGHVYERIKPADLARLNGLDPDAPCFYCGRSIKRHFAPNSRDRVEGIRNEFIGCPGMEILQYKSSGCPKCGNKIKQLVCDVCKHKMHAHYAMFPEELVEIPVKAACPGEVCNRCGEPRFPILEPTEEYKRFLGKGYYDHENDEGAGMMQDKDMPSISAEYKIIGWTSCECNAGFKPGVCLDPFMGFGTVASVALQNGRNFLGIELDPLNVKASYKRIEGLAKNDRLI